MKHFFIDLETTGRDAVKNGIHQMAGIILVDGAEVERFDWRVRPFQADVIEDEALAVAGVTREQIGEYPLPGDVYAQMIRTLDKYVDRFDKRDKFLWWGYSARFDNDFLRVWFDKCRDRFFGSWFWTPVVDVMTLAGLHLAQERAEMANFKQGTVAARLGLELDEARLHDALYDIETTMRIARAVLGEERWQAAM